MTTLTLRIPFNYTYLYGPDSEVLIPVARPRWRLAEQLERDAPAGEYEEGADAVRTTLHSASAIHAYLKDQGPDSPRLSVDPATSPEAHDAFYRAALTAAKGASPSGFTTASIRFDVPAVVTSDFEASTPAVSVTWTGLLEVTWQELD